MKWKNKGREYDNLAKIICNDENKYYLWGGAGVLGESFYKDFSGKINILGFIDSNPDKQGKRDDGIYVYAPNEFTLGENEKVLIVTGWVKVVSDLLDTKGYKKNIDYFLLDEFSTIFMMYKYNKLYIEKMDMMCNTKCTLRCIHCSSLIPYQKNGANDSLEEMKESVNLLFQWVDYVHIFSFGGGDVMLHPDLKKFIEYVGKTFKGKQIQDFELYTNAIIMPDQEMLEIWKKYDVIVRFTDYSKNVPGRQKIDQMKSLLEENHLRYDHVKFDNWMDTGYPQESNGIHGEEALISHCRNCSPVICTSLRKNKIFYCSPACAADASGLFEHVEEDGFSLRNFHPDRKKEFMEFYTGFSEKGYPSYCQRCNGLFNTNNKCIEVAEQIPPQTSN